MSIRIKNRLISPLGIFLLVLVIYIPFFCYFFFYDNTHYSTGFAIRDGSDAPAYAVLAENLIRQHRYSSASVPLFTPNTLRTPGYPFFIAAVLFVCKSYIFISFAQILLNALTAVLIYLVAKSMLPKAGAFAASLLYAFEFNTITLTINLLSETLFIFLIVLAVYLVFFSRYSLQHRAVVIGGLLLGCAILVRPIGLFLPILFVFFYAIINRMHGWKMVLKNTTLIAFGAIVIVIPWMVRNERLTGHFSLTSLGTYDILFYNVSYFLVDKNHIPAAQVAEEIREEVGITKTDNEEDPKYAGRISAVAFGYIRRYPLQYALYHLEKEAGVFAQSSLSYFLNEASKLKLKLIQLGLVDDNHTNINRLFTRGEYGQVFSAVRTQSLLFLDRLRWICTALFMLVPFIIRRKDYFWQKLLLLAIVLYLPFLSAPIGDVRYRVPAEPFMFILAVWGVWELYRLVTGLCHSKHEPQLSGHLPSA